MSNRQLEETQEEVANRHLASELGITYEDLCELEWDIDTNESNEGLIYEYIVRFSDSSSKDILNKISKLEDGCIVRLDPSVFADENDSM